MQDLYHVQLSSTASHCELASHGKQLCKNACWPGLRLLCSSSIRCKRTQIAKRVRCCKLQRVEVQAQRSQRPAGLLCTTSGKPASSCSANANDPSTVQIVDKLDEPRKKRLEDLLQAAKRDVSSACCVPCQPNHTSGCSSQVDSHQALCSRGQAGRAAQETAGGPAARSQERRLERLLFTLSTKLHVRLLFARSLTPSAVQIVDKLDEPRKRRLEDLLQAAKSGTHSRLQSLCTALCQRCSQQSAVQIVDKLDEPRKKRLEDLLQAAKSGSSSPAPTARSTGPPSRQASGKVGLALASVKS